MTKNRKYYSKKTTEKTKILFPEFIEGLKFCLNAFDSPPKFLLRKNFGGFARAIKIPFQESRSQAGKIFFSFLLIGVFLLPVFCSAKVVINEIMIGQTGVANNEFIELYNPTENNIDLKGYALKKKTKSGTESNLVSSSKFIGIISAYGYFLIAHPLYKDIIDADLAYSGTSYYISGDNTIILYDQEKNIADKVGYGEAADFENQPAPEPKNNQSIEREPTGTDTDNNSADFVIRDTPTPQNSKNQPAPEETPVKSESQNISAASNYPPYAEAGPDIVALTNQKLIFDGSKSWDPDWNNLTFFWNFGDGATDVLATTTHSYLYPGQYIATLAVGDGQFSDIDALTVNVFDNSVIISEFSPEQGWIELFNQSNQIANLSSWRLNNFVFSENSLIAPKQYLTLTKEITRLESNGRISLMYPNGSTACQIDYEKDKPNKAMAFDGQNYFWTNLATPGSSNIINLADLENKSYLTTNNPSVQTKPKEEKIALEQKDIFSVKTAETEVETEKETENNKPEENKEENKYAASLSQAASQTAATNEKKKLILIISIVVSASFVLALAIILLKRKIFN